MSETDVRQASDRFYQALQGVLAGDPSGMEGIWSHSDDVSTFHPIGGAEVGWERVWGSWVGASRAIGNGGVEVTDLRVVVMGDTAFTTGVEHAHGTIGTTQGRFDARCTNIYRKESGSWKIVHHHSDIDPALAAALQQLMSQA